MTGRPIRKTEPPRQRPARRAVYPFAGLVGQEEMKLALLLNAVAPVVGGVLIMGERGTGKSTAVRAIADLLPPLKAVRGCAYKCDPADFEALCDDCRARLDAEGKLPSVTVAAPIVELPLGATEDRVCGTIDIEQALSEGHRSFEPGLLARANRGFLYIDEVNLLEDHLVDLLLDAAAAGVNRVEREGVSLEHPSRFVLVGSGNPEEGELRPQLLDRFGLSAEVRTLADIDARVLIVERGESFASDPRGFAEKFRVEQEALRRRLARARRSFGAVAIPRAVLRRVAELCQRLGVDGHRGELTIVRAARALAAFEGRRGASDEDVRRVAPLALRHRLRRDPLEQSEGGARVEERVEEIFGHAPAEPALHLSTADERPGRDEDGAPATADKRGGAGSRGRGDAAGDDPMEAPAPPADSSLPDDALKRIAAREKKSTPSAPHLSTRRRGARKTTESPRGRYAGAATIAGAHRIVALDATLRAAAVRASARGGAMAVASSSLLVASSDLRYKRFRSRAGTLYVLAVDASGSMAANRISQAKGAMAHLLRRSYLNRDRVALVSFRADGGHILLPPCAAPARAKRILDALPVGGATPLAAGLLCALDVARRAFDEGMRRVVLVLFTDGRANVPLTPPADGGRRARRGRITSELERIGAAFKRASISSLVVDTANRFTSGGEGARLASALGGAYCLLPALPSGSDIAKSLDL